jgi:hypothetical protein
MASDFPERAWKAKGFRYLGLHKESYWDWIIAILSRRWRLLLQQGREKGKILMEKKDHHAKKEIDEISDKQIGPFLLAGRICGEAAAVQIYASEEVYGNGDDEDHEKKRGQKRCALYKYSKNQEKTSYQLNPGEGNCEDID